MRRPPLLTLASCLAFSCAAPAPVREPRHIPFAAPLHALPPPPEPVRPAYRGEAALARNDACEGCHPDVASEWRASLHRASWTEPAFQAAYAAEPLPFCRGCHAPEAPPAAAPAAVLGGLGVGCVTCHVDGDSILGPSRPSGSGAEPRPAPHGVVRDGRLDGAIACAGCHEFAFPEGGAPVGAPVPMQLTVTEHRASPAASRSCASCHMQATGGRRSHLFAASRDERALRAAVQVEARRTGPTSVEVRLFSRVEGHAFPTGDLFRRLEVLAEAVGPDETLAASATGYLARHFPVQRTGPGGPRVRVVGPDDRLQHEPVVLVLDLGERARDLTLRFRVAYQRVAHPRGADERASRIEGEVVLAQGELPPLSMPERSPDSP